MLCNYSKICNCYVFEQKYTKIKFTLVNLHIMERQHFNQNYFKTGIQKYAFAYKSGPSYNLYSISKLYV